jgi:hypothetical protein
VHSPLFVQVSDEKKCSRLQVLGQGVHPVDAAGPKHEAGEPVASVHGGGGAAGQDAARRDAHLRVHHRLQRRARAAADLLRAAGQRHGHRAPAGLLLRVPHSAGVAAGHPLRHAPRPRAGVRAPPRPAHKADHWHAVGDHPAPANRRGARRCRVLHGRRRRGRAQAPLRHRCRHAVIRAVDRAAVPGVRRVGDVHGRRADRVLLQAGVRGDAGLPHRADLLLLRVRVLRQLGARVAGEQGPAGPVLLDARRAQRGEFLLLPDVREVVQYWCRWLWWSLGSGGGKGII